MTDEYTLVPLSPIRKVIAARMLESSQTIPHFRITADIEVDALLEARAQLQSRNPGEKLSLNDLLIKACASALMDVPGVNLQWAENQIRRYHNADVSIVTALEDGLATPIVRRANTKTIWQISREVKELAARAANNALRMDEIFGGSFSMSNLGMYDVDLFDAIINPPQCAILAIGRARSRVAESAEHTTRLATVLRATLSADHRAIDGATAAKFLSAFRVRTEQPRYLTVET